MAGKRRRGVRGRPVRASRSSEESWGKSPAKTCRQPGRSVAFVCRPRRGSGRPKCHSGQRPTVKTWVRLYWRCAGMVLRAQLIERQGMMDVENARCATGWNDDNIPSGANAGERASGQADLEGPAPSVDPVELALLLPPSRPPRRWSLRPGACGVCPWHPVALAFMLASCGRLDGDGVNHRESRGQQHVRSYFPFFQGPTGTGKTSCGRHGSRVAGYHFLGANTPQRASHLRDAHQLTAPSQLPSLFRREPSS
jgi:hypothetical protein